jgi:hypothetical protein
VAESSIEGFHDANPAGDPRGGTATVSQSGELSLVDHDLNSGFGSGADQEFRGSWETIKRLLRRRPVFWVTMSDEDWSPTGQTGTIARGWCRESLPPVSAPQRQLQPLRPLSGPKPEVPSAATFIDHLTVTEPESLSSVCHYQFLAEPIRNRYSRKLTRSAHRPPQKTHAHATSCDMSTCRQRRG